MAENIYDEIEIEDMTYDTAREIYHYPCPCGDRFEIAIADLLDGEDIGVCPSCSLMIRVIYEVVSLLGIEGSISALLTNLRMIFRSHLLQLEQQQSQPEAKDNIGGKPWMAEEVNTVTESIGQHGQAKKQSRSLL